MVYMNGEDVNAGEMYVCIKVCVSCTSDRGNEGQNNKRQTETGRETGSRRTGVVEECMRSTAVLRGRDQLPDEALDVLVATVMQQAEDQDDSADGLHIPLAQPALAARMGQDITPAPPSGGHESIQE